MTPIELPGTTYKVVRNGTPTLVGDNCSFGPPQDWGSQGVTVWTPISASNDQECTFIGTMPIRVYNTALPASGDIPGNPQALNFGQPGWAGMDKPVDGFWYTASTTPIPVRYVGCTVSPSSTTVTLPTLPASDLATVGATAGETPFSITLTGCTHAGANYVVQASWSFTPEPALPTVMINDADPLIRAANVGIQMRDAGNTPIANGATTTLATITGTGTYTAQYSARYYATGAATSGAVMAVATFTLVYQ